MTGCARIVKMRIRVDVRVMDEWVIASTWICTKSFWFLRPTDELLSFKSFRVSFGVQPKW